ncbi:MAG: hypothetical protein JO085_08860, partial [Acidimicrobiia bacterium]|nr:hypothetical protein [Acidimicrobiia bacterium]
MAAINILQPWPRRTHVLRPSLARRTAMVAVAVTAVTVLGADLFILSQRNVTTPVTLG